MLIPAVSPARYKRPKVKAEPYTELHWPLWSALNASYALFVVLLNPSNEYESALSKLALCCS